MLFECHVNYGLSIFYRLILSGMISHFDLILGCLHLRVVCDWHLSASWHVGHSGYKRHSRRSCSRNRHTFWPAPPSYSSHVCLCSFYLRTEDKKVKVSGRNEQMADMNVVSDTNPPVTCGPQGIVLQNCSCGGLVLESHSWLCFLSGVRHLTSLICKPFPQEREHWEWNK